MWVGSGSQTVADGLGPGGGRGVGPLALKSICGVIEGKAWSTRPDGLAVSLPERVLRLYRFLPLFCACLLAPVCLGPNEQDLSLTWVSAGRVEGLWPEAPQAAGTEEEAAMLGGSHSQGPSQQASSSIPELSTSLDQRQRFPSEEVPRSLSPADSPG